MVDMDVFPMLMMMGGMIGHVAEPMLRWPAEDGGARAPQTVVMHPTSNQRHALRYDTTRFLAPDVNGVDLRDGPLGTPRPSQGNGLAFIVEAAMPAAAARVAELRQRYSLADVQVHRSTRGDVLFTSFLVAPS